MTRQTSIEVYNQIQIEGLLSAVDLAVYSTLFHHGPLTQGETWKEHNSHQYMRHTVGPAFARLKRRDAITEVEKRTCRLTGRTVYSWDVTCHVPTKYQRPETMKQKYKKLEEKIKQLELEVQIWKRRAERFSDPMDVERMKKRLVDQLELGI